jgi:nucleoid-associated protein YgaU
LHSLDSDVAQDQPEQPTQPEAGRGRRRLWPWLLLIVIAALGARLGVSLGSRQGGPLAAPTGVAALASRPTILIGSPVPIASPVSSPLVTGSPSAEHEYVVEPGDTLRTIALREYGDAALWQRVYDANRDVIGPDPNTVQPGMRLRIPSQ